MDPGPSSSSTTTLTREAGPLPVKRGEIGFDTVANDVTVDTNTTNDEQVITLPERHPADRSTPRTAASTHSPLLSSPPASPREKGVVAKHTMFGFRTAQVAILCALLAVIIGTVIGWAVLGNLMGNNKIPSLTGYGSTIVHVMFTVFLLAMLIFFERRLFYARAERFARLRPDALDAASDACPSTLAPWARPPLPTYAATLAQSGVGTGDVEDHIIAAPPPPAYGNTRGSTLLLSGFLRQSMRMERPVSVVSRQSRRLGMEREERPVSYRSHDEQWEEYCDAQRARALEETLVTLERPVSALTRTR